MFWTWAKFSIRDATMKIALNVITAVGYGKRIEFASSTSMKTEEMSTGEAIQTIIGNIIKLALVPKLILNNMPISNFRQVGKAYKALKIHVQDLINFERNRDSSDGEQTILKMLVEQSSQDAKKHNQRILRDDEIMGNSFIFLLAGHETTYFPT
jgi:cytochrome P450